MRAERRIAPFLLIYGVLLLLPASRLPLGESTEGRYAEIAREMLVSGNLLEPTLNGVYHFHKPPLPYWAMAAGMHLFGTNEFGARFFGIVAAILTLYFLYRTAAYLFGDRRDAELSVLVMASSGLFLAVSRIVATDIYLTCCVAGALCFLFRQACGRRSPWNAAGYGFMLGLGFLVKGPVVFVFTLLPQLASKIVDDGHRRLFRLSEIAAGIATFLVVALPWYIAVILRHPDLLAYFTKTQTVDRVATDRFGRSKPFWFFVALFPATFLPHSIAFLRGLSRYRHLPRRIKALSLYVLLPLVVFTLSKSKMAPYILPFYGTASLVAVHSLHAGLPRLERRAVTALLVLLGLVLAGAGVLVPELLPARMPLAAAGLATIACAAALYRCLDARRFVLGASCVIIAAIAAGYQALPYYRDHMKWYRDLCATMNGLDQERKVPTVVFRAFMPSISFYRGELAITALGKEREAGFEHDLTFRKWNADTHDDLRRAIGAAPRLFLVTEPAYLVEFEHETSSSCAMIARQHHYILYDCMRTASPSPPGIR